jgi:mRNA-degrading endonuclease YafQ of YafQ-DinJ toxin-antitoxin module
MKYRYKPTPRFWKSFYALPASQKESTRRAWAIFKENPFDPRLRPHKIQRLSSEYGCTIYAAEIEGDLRVVFYVEGDLVVTVDIGSHDVYRG